MCAMTHSYVCHHSCVVIHKVCHDPFMRAMTHSYVSHASFICVPWLIHMCAMTHSNITWEERSLVPCRQVWCCHTQGVSWPIHACHDSFICEPCLIHTCAMTRPYVCHDSFIYHLKREVACALSAGVVLSYMRCDSWWMYEWLSKEPYVYVKRALCICQKSPMYMTWEERSLVPCRQEWCCHTWGVTLFVRQGIG